MNIGERKVQDGRWFCCLLFLCMDFHGICHKEFYLEEKKKYANIIIILCHQWQYKLARIWLRLKHNVASGFPTRNTCRDTYLCAKWYCNCPITKEFGSLLPVARSSKSTANPLHTRWNVAATDDSDHQKVKKVKSLRHWKKEPLNHIVNREQGMTQSIKHGRTASRTIGEPIYSYYLITAQEAERFYRNTNSRKIAK